MNSLPLYQVILAYPPFDDWGEQRTLNIPLWRAVDTNGALLVLVTSVTNVYRAMGCMKSWQFAYKQASWRGNDLVLVGQVGDVACPHLEGKQSLMRRLHDVGGTRLVLNPPTTRNRKHWKGWDTWSPFGWHQIDLYAYPARLNHFSVDEGVIDSAQDLKRIFEDGKEWRWRMGDAVMRMIHSQNVPRMKAYQWASEAIGRQLSVQQIAAFTNLAEAVPPSQRDSTIDWGTYYDSAIRRPRKDKSDARV